ncbi:hypothetical protein G3I60_18930 [Streptomyces sp. SID13666]|uniref:hypothetical protein n=1 Tax=unclassified Streptomyces TaxID=2593676 RepID=UPI0013BF930F|nr:MULTISPECIES: hypothetical protein [unclassified Streptomyces]NEA56167.1 hypothetical protein [Streptomyces sp. SID13666]NEA71838.1 hypothetical protein [Streptomyces sp. SID13588]
MLGRRLGVVGESGTYLLPRSRPRRDVRTCGAPQKAAGVSGFPARGCPRRTTATISSVNDGDHLVGEQRLDEGFGRR